MNKCTDMFSQRYVEGHAACCPVCGHFDIEADPANPSTDHKYIHHHCECHGCGSVWTEVFVAVGVAGIAVKWTAADQEEALRQGWGLFVPESGVLEIQRHDVAGLFGGDDDARQYVLASGDMTCRKAVSYLMLTGLRDASDT